MHAYPRIAMKLVCKYTATTRRAKPIIMSAAIGSVFKELHKHPSNKIHDFHHKDVMARVSLFNKHVITMDHVTYGSRE